MLELDEVIAKAPEWYASVDEALARELFDEAARIIQDEGAEDKLLSALASAKMHTVKADLRAAKRKSQEALTLAKARGDQAFEAAALHRLSKAKLLGAMDDVLDSRGHCE